MPGPQHQLRAGAALLGAALWGVIGPAAGSSATTSPAGLMRSTIGSRINERPPSAERVITDIVNVDAGYAGVYAGHIGEASPAEARIDRFVYRVP